MSIRSCRDEEPCGLPGERIRRSHRLPRGRCCAHNRPLRPPLRNNNAVVGAGARDGVGLTSRAIGQAIGIVMERYRIGEDSAFAFLVRASTHGNVKLRDVAQEIVNSANAT